MMRNRWLAVLGGAALAVVTAMVDHRPARADMITTYIGCYVPAEEQPTRLICCMFPADDWGSTVCTNQRQNDGDNYCWASGSACYGIEVPGGGGGGGSCTTEIGSGCPASCPSCTYTY